MKGYSDAPRGEFRTDAFVRLLAIVEGATQFGDRETPSASIHAVAYFTDALAPVYDLPVLYPHLLKRRRPVHVPDLQYHLDRLVGYGIMTITDVRYELSASSVNFGALYELNRPLANPVLEAMQRRERTRYEVGYVRELTLALMGLGPDLLWRAAEADATYGDPNVDQGTIVELQPFGKKGSRAVRFANAFRSLSGDSPLAPSELVNLYVRHLYGILAESPS